MRTLRLAGTALIAGAAILIANSSSAWDSVTEEALHGYPVDAQTVVFFDGAGTPHLSHSDYLDKVFQMQILKDAIAGDSVAPNAGVTNLMRCPPSFALAADEGGGNLLECKPLHTGEVAGAQAAWITPRRAAEVPHHSEHAIITRQAVQLAGLAGTILFDPFWVRYPAQNAWIGSEVFHGGTPSLIVGQSLRPVAPMPGRFSYAARGISLPELSQVPDYSHSLGDWAAGNELCPVAGVENAYRLLHPTEACHKFKAAMGAINATHFRPLNREMWSYYHNLALNKMTECAAMAPLKTYFYDNFHTNFGQFEENQFSSADTEMHECERLAMAYEMFAQHFIQDAWSAGHMWMRWGWPTFEAFPADIAPLSSDIPELNRAPRRAVLAGIVAAVSGMVHGAKSVVMDVAREHTAPDTHAWLEKRGLFDDPLNGGRYGSKDVQWSDARGRFPTAGDLFWEPLLDVNPTAPRVNVDAKYVEQRNRILNCSAASIREVYRKGAPSAVRAHGVHNDALVPAAVKNTNPSSDTCWGHWITNEAMLGAIGPVDLTYVNVPVFDAQGALHSVLSNVNTLVLSKLRPAANFPIEREEDVPAEDELELRRVRDRTAFLRKLGARLLLDHELVRARYVYNAVVQPTGTHSARQQIVGNTTARISFLDVPAIDPITPLPTAPRGVDYVDVPPQKDTPNGAVSELNEALSRVFWRGDLQRTCRTSVENGASMLHGLRAKCSGTAPFGGDPEACTACVNLAELHIPSCWLGQDIAPSKCSSIGAESLTSPPSGLPSWWFDKNARVLGIPEAEGPFADSPQLCAPAARVALMWCTNTNYDQQIFTPTEPAVTSVAPHFEEASRVTCSPSFPGIFHLFGTRYSREARLLREARPSITRPWLPPMVTAFEYSRTNSPERRIDGSYYPTPYDPCGLLERDKETTSLDGIIAAQVAPATVELYDDYFEVGRNSGFRLTGPEVPRCGLLQRASWWAMPCAEAQATLGLNLPLDTFDPQTGSFVHQMTVVGQSGTEQTQCYVREPRSVRRCPDGYQCTAGRECVAEGIPPTTFTNFSPSLANWPE